MYMYSRKARNVISKIISNKLDFDKIPKSCFDVIIEYGLHGNLPSKFYDKAIQFDIANIRFMPPDSVKVEDLIELIDKTSSIDTKLYNHVLKHRKTLINHGIKFIKLMIYNNLLTRDDINFIISKKILTATQILKIDPMIASTNMILSKDDIIELIKSVPSYSIPYLYDNLSIDLKTLLYLSDTFNIAPTNESLLKLNDCVKAIELIKKYPEKNIINYISKNIKNNKCFIEKIHEIVKENLPILLNGLNKFLYLSVPKSVLVSMYGIKCIAMFSLDVMTDIKYISDEDKKFIEINISLYDLRCKEFATVFRDHIMKTESRVITVNPENIIKKSCILKKPVRHLKVNEENGIEGILIHIDNALAKTKLSLSEIKNILANFRLNPCSVRNVLLSNVSTKTKIAALKAIKQWKSQTLTYITTYQKMNKTVIIMDMLDSISTKILNNHANIFYKLKNLEKMAKMPLCNCLKCSTASYNIVKSNDVTIHERSNDDDLIKCLYDLVRYAIHGMVNPNIIGKRGWGPLISLLSDNVMKIKLNIADITESENLFMGDIMLSGNNLVNKLIPIVSTPVNNLTSTVCFPLNESYAKVVLLLNIIIEYMFSVLLYRIVIIQRFRNNREFISKIINSVFEGCGIYFCQLRVNENIDIEIDELIVKGSLPVHLIHLFLKVILIIFEDLNGTD
ncbi:hypothetical protein [Moosepox virus GoldyGopher14]|nr:hypothetical protein [Moosepox virus GoldyGopher14]